MPRFSKILVVQPAGAGPEGAFNCAVRLAAAHKSRLTLLSVVEGFPLKMLDQHPSLAGAWNEALSMVGGELDSIVRGLRDKGLEADAKVATGTEFIEIIREALRGGHDLVVKDYEDRAGLKSLALSGSNDKHLLRKCPCPVWIVRPAHRDRYKSVLAAVDPDPFNEERNGLNDRIMELAVSVARTENAKLLIAHAWDLAPEQMMRARGLVSNADLESYLNEAHAAHRKRLKELISRFDLTGVEHEEHMLKGKAWKIIPELEKDRKVDLAVMGTVARTGLHGLLMGNTAEEILNTLGCSVLAVKPEGFVSPVEP